MHTGLVFQLSLRENPRKTGTLARFLDHERNAPIQVSGQEREGVRINNHNFRTRGTPVVHLKTPLLSTFRSKLISTKIGVRMAALESQKQKP